MNTSWQSKKKSVFLNLLAVFLVILIAAIYFFWPEIVNVLKDLPEGGKGILWGMVAFLLLAASTRLWRRLKNFLELEKINNLTDPKDFFSARLELIKAGAQILGGMFFLVGLWFTYQNLIVAQEKNVTDLFTKAVEQLGSGQIEVRLGGIYALERIAKDSPKDRSAILEVLTACVRERAPWPPREKSPGAAEEKGNQQTRAVEPGHTKPQVKPPTDIQAILTVIGRRQAPNRPTEHDCLYLRETDLRGAYLYGARLGGADLIGSRLEGADLEGADLRGALLEEVIFGTILGQKTNLKGTDLRGATGLTWEQVKEAELDEKTKLPNYVLEKKKKQGGGTP